MRITAQLIKADDGIGLWTDNYDRELTDVFAIEEDIATAIANALRVPLGLQQGERLVSNRTSDVTSYQDYLRGRALVRSRVVNEAVATLEGVVKRDPDYAPAWAMLSQAYRLILDYTPTTRTGSVDEARRFIQATLAKAESAARKAIELDPKHAGGYAALAYIQATRGNEQRDRFGDGVDVQRDGDTLNVRILGDVLFQLDSARLRPEARALIRSITVELMQFSDVDVNGFTDTSGTSEHNDILSQERADAVADELVRNGIDARRIRAQGFGETRLAVPTPDGVRERQNRRVEIVLAP